MHSKSSCIELLAKKASHASENTSITYLSVKFSITILKGDYIVTNLATKAKESYIIPPDKFSVKYKKVKTISRGVGLYSPKGKVHAIALTKSLLTTLK